MSKRVNVDMKKAKEIAHKKLAGWKEDDHEADRMAAGLVEKGEDSSV